MTTPTQSVPCACAVTNAGFDRFGLAQLHVACPNRGDVPLEVCLACAQLITLDDGFARLPALVCTPPAAKG